MLFTLAVLILLTHIGIACEVIIGSRKISFLRDIEPLPDDMPSVSIIVAARNEERHIQQGLQSLLQLDYPTLQLILVNDRSEDRTGILAQELAEKHPMLNIVEITELPEGWLGKNHALWRGSQLAEGELLLFTDADVVMAPDVLQRAVHYLQQRQLDHLAVTPDARMPSWLLNSFGLTFGFFFALFTRPWRAVDPRSDCHIGIGAFNLVRKAIYRDSGGHRAIAMRPDDDLKLGKLVKLNGGHQELLYGTGLVQVEWYSSVKEVIHGLEKNLFAGTEYRVWMMLSGFLFNLIFILWPYPALFIGGVPERFCAGLTVILLTLMVAASARFHGYRTSYALAFPLTVGLFNWIILRTLCLNLVQGGIYWRGTFYPLKLLRKNRIH